MVGFEKAEMPRGMPSQFIRAQFGSHRSSVWVVAKPASDSAGGCVLVVAGSDCQDGCGDGIELREKPLALNAAQAREMYEKAEAARRRAVDQRESVAGLLAAEERRSAQLALEVERLEEKCNAAG